MDVSLKLENRAINPAVINLFQFENNTTTLNFVLDSYIWENSDLRNYKAYAITSINGIIDYTELEMTYDEGTDKLSLSWLVQDYTLSEKGAITYQIVFKENTIEGNAGEEDVNTAVWYSYKAIIINRESLDGDNHIVANYPTILKQYFDKIQELAGTLEAGIVYIPYGETIEVANRLAGRVYYQYTDAYNVTGRFEDHEGNILIDNQSLTAVELQPNVDLNDIRESGVYYTSLNTNAATMSNTPIKEAFYLEVISMDENLTKQVWTHFNTTVGDVYTRKYYRGTWGEWYKTATTKYVDGTFLPLKGGTMSGTIVMPELSANIKGKDNTGQITILGGTEWDKGSHIMLRGNDRENNGGEFSIVCADGTNYQSLVGNLKGKLTWQNKNIVRSVGGVEADVNGNVEIIAYDDMSFNGTELKLSKTNGTSTSVDLGDKFADLTSDQNIGGTKTFTTSPKVPTVASSSNDTTAANTQWVTAKIDSLDVTSQITSIMNTIYPVGSFYFCTQDTCPLSAIISGSTWEKVGSSLITSVNTNVPVKGDGKSLGLTNGNNQNFGIRGSGSQTPVATGQYGVTLPKSISDDYRPTNQYVFGVTTDSSKSGIVGTVTRTALTVNIFKRTA